MSRYSYLFIGCFFLLNSFLSFINIIYSYYFNFYLNVNSYLPPLIISFFGGIFFIFFKFKNKKLSIFDKVLFVISGYIIFPIIIALPYYFSIYDISFINSFFESISGFTSTGFTTFDNVQYLDPSLILWRSTSQWVGGLYFLFSIILLINIFDNNLKKSLTNFLSFDTSEFFKQSLKVFFIYLLLTIIIFFILKFINFRNFDALNFSLSIISSGGFKSVNNLDYILNNDFKIIVFSFLLLISFFSIFLIYNLIFHRFKYLNYFTEDFYLLVYLISITFFLFVFFSNNNFSLILFSISSSVSNIGFYLSDNLNNNLSTIFLILVIIGGSFFSTSSGIRFFKIFTLFRFALNNLLSHTKPKQILLSKVKFDETQINYEVINKYFLSIIIFIISLSIISALLTLSGLEFDQSVKLGILTIMNTVNSSLYGLENFEFQNLNILSKFILINFMIIGRVEFLTIIILFKKYLFKN